MTTNCWDRRIGFTDLLPRNPRTQNRLPPRLAKPRSQGLRGRKDLEFKNPAMVPVKGASLSTSIPPLLTVSTPIQSIQSITHYKMPKSNKEQLERAIQALPADVKALNVESKVTNRQKIYLLTIYNIIMSYDPFKPDIIETLLATIETTESRDEAEEVASNYLSHKNVKKQLLKRGAIRRAIMEINPFP